jgi:hypothetical protein
VGELEPWHRLSRAWFGKDFSLTLEGEVKGALNGSLGPISQELKVYVH